MPQTGRAGQAGSCGPQQGVWLLLSKMGVLGGFDHREWGRQDREGEETEQALQMSRGWQLQPDPTGCGGEDCRV